MNPAIILPAVSIGCCLFFFFYFRSFLKRRTSAEELLAEYRAEVYRLIAEIDAATDRDSLLVEERIKTLKALLEDTDKRISVYMRELDRSRAGEALYTSLGRGIRAAIGAAPQVSDRQQTAAESAPAAPAAAPPAPPPPVETAPPAGPSAKQQLRAQVAELTGRGLSPAEIASRLGLSLAEVDLALNLLPKNRG
jgi:hypothetical protein